MQVHRKLFCGDYIELQYYNHLGGKKSNNSGKVGSLVMGNISKICYSFQDVLWGAEIKSSRNVGGNNPLLKCRDCIKIPTSGGSINSQENQVKGWESKTRKPKVAVQRSNKKAIK